MTRTEYKEKCKKFINSLSELPDKQLRDIEFALLGVENVVFGGVNVRYSGGKIKNAPKR